MKDENYAMKRVMENSNSSRIPSNIFGTYVGIKFLEPSLAAVKCYVAVSTVYFFLLFKEVISRSEFT